MISLLAYIVKLLLNLFVTTILVTDINSSDRKDSKNLKFIMFCSFFTFTLSSVCSLITTNNNSFFYGSTILVIFFVINSLIDEFSIDEKLKIYLICLCSFLFGIGGITLTLIAFVASVISYIILYNSADFYKFFFSKEDNEKSDNPDLKEKHDI